MGPMGPMTMTIDQNCQFSARPPVIPIDIATLFLIVNFTSPNP